MANSSHRKRWLLSPKFALLSQLERKMGVKSSWLKRWWQAQTRLKEMKAIHAKLHHSHQARKTSKEKIMQQLTRQHVPSLLIAPTRWDKPDTLSHKLFEWLVRPSNGPNHAGTQQHTYMVMSAFLEPVGNINVYVVGNRYGIELKINPEDFDEFVQVHSELSYHSITSSSGDMIVRFRGEI